MEAQKQRVENGTRKSSVSAGVNVVDATFEHLTVLRVLIEGLAGKEAEGFWLKNLHGIPMVPRISPLDLMYLDKEHRVLEVAELLPAGEFPQFRAPAVTALVLPFQSIRSSGTVVGDQLHISAVPVAASAEESAPTPEPMMAMPAAPSVAAPVAPEPLMIVEADPALVAAGGPATPPAPPQRETKEYVRPGVRPRKPKTLRKRAPKEKQTTPRLKENAYRQTPFIVESAPVAQPVQPPAAHAAEIKPRPPEAVAPQPVAAKQTQVVEPAVKSAKNGKLPKPAEASRTTPAKEQLPAAWKSIQKHVEAAGKTSVREHLERLLKWLSPNSYSEERRSSIRRPAQGLVAYSALDGTPRKFDVGDISSSGVFLRTNDAWEPGMAVDLTLQPGGALEERRDKRIDVRAGAVRRGADGVGLAFDFPQGVDLDLWECAVRGKTYESGPEYIVHEMRMARALGTIRRVCPAAADQAKQMLHKEFSNVRVASAVRIAYIAEDMLTRTGDEPGIAPVELVSRILDTGSWADLEWIQEMWAGLLVTSCSSDGEDQSNAVFIDILSQLAPVHLRILGIASERAARPGPIAGPFTVNCCTAAELTKALDLSNLTKTLRSIQELADMGLMAAAKRSPSDPQDENAKTAITPQGLEMITRCHGRRMSTTQAEAPAAGPAKEPARLGSSYSANAS